MPVQIIAVDFDGTLAQYEEGQPLGFIGEPVWRMVRWVQYQLALGNQVEIFTARIYQNEQAIPQIQDWLEDAGLPRLPVGNIKRPDFSLFVDDRARQCLKNEGIIVEYRSSSGSAPLQNSRSPRQSARTLLTPRRR